MNNDFHQNRVIYELFEGLALEGLTKSPIPTAATPAANGHSESISNGNGLSNGVSQPITAA